MPFLTKRTYNVQ